MKAHRLVVVASTNPVKLAAVEEGFRLMFPETDVEFTAISVPSGVDYQPMSEDETLRGATNRVNVAAREVPGAAFWIGIEGGIAELYEGTAAFAWVVTRSGDVYSRSRSGTFFLPKRVTDLIHDGYELGHANDLVFGENNSKQKGGAIGLLTGGILDRTDLYAHAVVLSLVLFRNPGLYEMHGTEF